MGSRGGCCLRLWDDQADLALFEYLWNGEFSSSYFADLSSIILVINHMVEL